MKKSKDPIGGDSAYILLAIPVVLFGLLIWSWVH